MSAQSTDVELLEAYLDRELDTAAIAALELRLPADPILAQTLASLRQARETRVKAMSLSFGRDEGAVERLIASVRAARASEAIAESTSSAANDAFSIGLPGKSAVELKPGVSGPSSMSRSPWFRRMRIGTVSTAAAALAIGLTVGWMVGSESRTSSLIGVMPEGGIFAPDVKNFSADFSSDFAPAVQHVVRITSVSDGRVQILRFSSREGAESFAADLYKRAQQSGRAAEFKIEVATQPF